MKVEIFVKVINIVLLIWGSNYVFFWDERLLQDTVVQRRFDQQALPRSLRFVLPRYIGMG